MTLIIRLPGHRAKFLRGVLPGGDALRIDLERAPVVSGVVLNAYTHEPIPSFRLQVENDQMGMTTAWSDPLGRFVLDTLDETDHVLTVEAPGYESRTVEGVNPGRNASAPLRILLTPSS